MATYTRATRDQETGEVLVALIALPLLILFEGWAVAHMWGWFVVPFGLPTIDTLHGVGIATLVSMVATNTDTKGEALLAGALAVAIKVALLLTVAWCAHSCGGAA